METHPWGPARRRNRAPSHVSAPPGRQTPEHAAEGRSRPAARTAARGWTRCCGADRDEGDKTEVDGRLIRLPGGHGDDTPALPRRGTTTPTTTGTTSAKGRRKGEEDGDDEDHAAFLVEERGDREHGGLSQRGGESQRSLRLFLEVSSSSAPPQSVASGIVRRILYGWFVSWFFRSLHGYFTAWRWTDDAWSSRLGVVMVVVSSEERRKELEGGGQAPHSTPRFFSFPFVSSFIRRVRVCRITQQRRRRSGARRLQRARGSLCESPQQHGHDHDGDEANDHDGYEGDKKSYLIDGEIGRAGARAGSADGAQRPVPLLCPHLVPRQRVSVTMF